jgi:DNA-binding transcriptional LysR family regulator
LRQATEIEKLTSSTALNGRLRLGATSALANSLVPRLCGRFASLHPGVLIDLTVASSMDVIAKVHRMSLDIGFIGSPANRSDLESREWVDDPLAVFCSRNHPCAEYPGRPLIDLLGEDWALEKAMSSERISLTMEALKHMSSLRIVFESESVDAVKAAASEGNLIGCLSRRTLAAEFASGLLVDLAVPELAFVRRSTIIWKKTSYQGALQESFIDFASEVANEMDKF